MKYALHNQTKTSIGLSNKFYQIHQPNRPTQYQAKWVSNQTKIICLLKLKFWSVMNGIYKKIMTFKKLMLWKYEKKIGPPNKIFLCNGRPVPHCLFFFLSITLDKIFQRIKTFKKKLCFLWKKIMTFFLGIGLSGKCAK